MILLLLVGLGLIFGSFVNALVWRLRQGKDWVRGRSECTHCHHPLAAKDLVPVLSWLWLRGKCRYCRQPIHDNPLAEIAVPILFVVSYWAWPVELVGQGIFTFVVWCALIVGFVALAAYDFRWFELPDRIVFVLVAIAAMQVMVVALWERDPWLLVGPLSGMIVVAGIFYVLFQLSGGTWIGGGDVKLGIVLGLLAGGFLEGFLVLFFASLLALVATLPQVIRGRARRKTQIPFGPFLIGGLIVVVLYGQAITSWYEGLLYV